jgi:hypothetical protein
LPPRRGPDPCRVARLYLAAPYDNIYIPLPFDDPQYWGFEGEQGETAARSLNLAVRKATARMEALGREAWAGISAAVSVGNVAQAKALVAHAVSKVKLQSSKEWVALAGELLSYSDLDMDPLTSRTNISEPFRQLYRQLAKRAVGPEAEPLHALYLALMPKVNGYFEKL